MTILRIIYLCANKWALACFKINAANKLFSNKSYVYIYIYVYMGMKDGIACKKK